MQFAPLKIAVVTAWVISIVAIGLTLPVTSATGWMTIAGFGLLPFLFMRLAWRQPAQTMSESISEETTRR